MLLRLISNSSNFLPEVIILSIKEAGKEQEAGDGDVGVGIRALAHKMTLRLQSKVHNHLAKKKPIKIDWVISKIDISQNRIG